MPTKVGCTSLNVKINIALPDSVPFRRENDEEVIHADLQRKHALWPETEG